MVVNIRENEKQKYNERNESSVKSINVEITPIQIISVYTTSLLLKEKKIKKQL